LRNSKLRQRQFNLKNGVNNLSEEIEVVKKYQRAINKKYQEEFEKVYENINQKEEIHQKNISEINLKISLLHENQTNNLSKIKALRTSAEEYTYFQKFITKKTDKINEKLDTTDSYLKEKMHQIKNELLETVLKAQKNLEKQNAITLQDIELSKQHFLGVIEQNKSFTLGVLKEEAENNEQILEKIRCDIQ